MPQSTAKQSAAVEGRGPSRPSIVRKPDWMDLEEAINQQCALTHLVVMALDNAAAMEITTDGRILAGIACLNLASTERVQNAFCNVFDATHHPERNA